MPLAIAALGLTAVGTGMAIAGNEKSQRAINAARGAYVNSQDQLSRKSNAIAQKSIAGSGPDVAAQEMQAGQNTRMSIWDNLQKSTVPVASALPATATGKTAQTQARSSGAANAWNKLTAKSAAREGSYADWENQQAIKNATAAQDIGVNNNFSEGNARLFPTELEVAGQSGDRLTGWGNIVSSLGTLAGLAATTSPSAKTAPAATTPSTVRPNVGFDTNTNIPTNTYA